MRDRHVAGFAADQIDALRKGVRVFKIKSRRGDLVAKGEDGENSLQSAGGSEQMTRG